MADAKLRGRVVRVPESEATGESVNQADAYLFVKAVAKTMRENGDPETSDQLLQWLKQHGPVDTAINLQASRDVRGGFE